MAERVTLPVYQVTVQPGGEQFDCAPDQLILNAAHAANILISYSCRNGQCGSCMGRIVEGEIDYPAGQPEALNEQQGREGYALFCSAVARSDLVIELLQPSF